MPARHKSRNLPIHGIARPDQCAQVPIVLHDTQTALATEVQQLHKLNAAQLGLKGQEVSGSSSARQLDDGLGLPRIKVDRDPMGTTRLDKGRSSNTAELYT